MQGGSKHDVDESSRRCLLFSPNVSRFSVCFNHHNRQGRVTLTTLHLITPTFATIVSFQGWTAKVPNPTFFFAGGWGVESFLCASCKREEERHTSCLHQFMSHTTHLLHHRMWTEWWNFKKNCITFISQLYFHYKSHAGIH